jgi:hypothetical protein
VKCSGGMCLSSASELWAPRHAALSGPHQSVSSAKLYRSPVIAASQWNVVCVARAGHGGGGGALLEWRNYWSIHKATTGTAFVSSVRAVETCRPNVQPVTGRSRHPFEKLAVAQLLTDFSLRRLGFHSRTVA